MLEEPRQKNCHNGKDCGYFPGGKYSYEKHFAVPQEYPEQKVSILFEGVYQNAVVYLNGEPVAKHRYGYTEFTADITGKVREGENFLRVTVDNSLEPNCRWYTGSGIYRPVSLIIKPKNAVKPVKIRTVSLHPAVIEVATETENASVEIWDGETCIAKGAPGTIPLPEAKLWDAEHPNLYTCVVKTSDDEEKFPFGIRTLTWSAQNGLCVNGNTVKLRGGCIHHDNGILGACGFAEAEERRIRIMKKAGYNAVRCAHNPASRALLDACDRLGMYVMDEAFDGWFTPKTYHDYSRIFESAWREDLSAMIQKDYNHPSVVLYSIGNEVTETACEQGVQTAEQMTALAHALDNTRPVTAGINVLLNVYNQKGIGVYKETESYKPEPLPPKKQEEKKKESGSAFFNMVMQHLGPLMFYMSKGKKGDAACRAVAEKLDILGLNYAASRYEEDCLTYPNRIMVGSETIIGELPYNWEQVKKHPAVIGDFAWAAIDYLGEAGIGQMIPQDTPGLPIAAGSGAIDLTGNITAESYFQQAVWSLRKAPYLGVRPVNWNGRKMTGSAWRMTNAVESWTWPGCEGQKATVEVCSDAEFVALYCNDTLIGKKRTKKFRAIFKLPYRPGTLKAVALDKSGNALGETTLQTAGQKTRLHLSPEKTTLRADGQSLCFIPITLTDAAGIWKPCANAKVHLEIEGPAALQALGSAATQTDETYLGSSHTTWLGRALAVIRAGTEPGKVRVTVTAEGYEPQYVDLTVE
nr:glycoside hydrolase family 2 TIM barrel-domain containing protein [uncultured Gemmiger sp.]